IRQSPTTCARSSHASWAATGRCLRTTRWSRQWHRCPPRGSRRTCDPSRHGARVITRVREMLVVYTTVIGDTKPLHDPQIPSHSRFVCFTDQDITSTTWEIRSEEHTSELQSRENLVCRLLL